MSSSIRGHKGEFRLFENGQLKNIVNCTSVNVAQDSSFSRAMYVGNPVPEGDQTHEGFSGSAEFQVKDSSIEDFIDNLIANNLNGIGVSEYTFIVSESYPDGSLSSYVYFDCQWKYSRNQSGLNEKVTKRLDFQASGRVKL
jgi:hypothetical protein